MLNNNNGGKLWRWRKVDILFLAGVTTILYGAYTFHPEVMIVGGAIAGVPLWQRLDKP